MNKIFLNIYEEYKKNNSIFIKENEKYFDANEIYNLYNNYFLKIEDILNDHILISLYSDNYTYIRKIYLDINVIFNLQIDDSYNHKVLITLSNIE